MTTTDAPQPSTPESGPRDTAERTLVARRAGTLVRTIQATVPPHLRRAVVEAVVARLEGAAEAPARPAAPAPRVSAPRRAPRAVLASAATRWPGADPDVALLLERDVLHVGDVLHGPAGPGTVEAVVTPSGGLTVGDKTYADPSAAASALVGYRRNGWTFWHAPTSDDASTSLAVLVSRNSSALRR